MLTDRFGCRPTALLGSLLGALGLVTTALTTEVWQLNFTFGILTGKAGLLFHSPNIYKEAGKLSVHYATFPALLPYSCRVHKEQNDQIQESDAGTSVRVSGQNRRCAAVCSMSTILLPGHW